MGKNLKLNKLFEGSMGKKNIMLHNYSEESMEGRFEVNNSSEESMGKKIK